MATHTLVSASDTVDSHHFAQLVRDFIGLLGVRWRARLRSADGAEFIPVHPAEAEKLLEIIDWLADAVTSTRRSCKAPPPSGGAPVEGDSRDLFIGMLAHDLRTPLNAIILTAGTEVRRAEGPQRCAAARVLRCAERMRRMIADLLDFARVQLGTGIPVRPQRFSLAALAEEIIEEVQESRPGARVCLDCREEVIGEWDRDRLAQVLSNLVANAVGHGVLEGEIAVRLTRRDEVAWIEVVNRGEPIPECDMKRLFEPFERAQSSRSRPESIGLGLFIVREIVAAHGGRVTASNSAESGTVTFSVALPLYARASP
jgi:signal transduction histidine kinase